MAGRAGDNVATSKIGLEHLVYVNAVMADQANHWNQLGEQLGISESRRGIIRANYPVVDVGKCLIEILVEWLKNGRNSTWEDLVKAIRTYDVRAANTLATILQGPGVPHSLITGPIPELDIDGVDDSELNDTAAIISALYEAKATKKWLEIGLFLGISYGDLEILKTKFDDEQVRGMVGIWTRWNYAYERFGQPSWKNLVRAIGARVGGNFLDAAKDIADKHRTGPADSATGQ